MQVSDKIRNARLAAGLTQEELARKMQVSSSMIGIYENGVRKPKLDTINRFAVALGCDPSELWDDELLKASEIKSALDQQDGAKLSELLGGRVEFVPHDRREEQKLITAFRHIPERMRKILLQLVEELADGQI